MNKGLQIFFIGLVAVGVNLAILKSISSVNNTKKRPQIGLSLPSVELSKSKEGFIEDTAKAIPTKNITQQEYKDLAQLYHKTRDTQDNMSKRELIEQGKDYLRSMNINPSNFSPELKQRIKNVLNVH